MKKRSLLMTGLLVTNLTVAQASNTELKAQTSNQSAKKWGISLSTEGGYSNVGEGSGKIDLFIPIAQNSEGLTFIDLRGQLSGAYSNDNYSIAVGHRRMVKPNVAVGINTSYDTGSSTLTGERRDQLAVGLEVFSDVANVKVNFFRAMSDASAVAGTGIAPVAQITNGQFQLVKKLEDSEAGMNGFSLQVDRSFNLANDLVLDVMAMAYAYGADNAGEDFNGVMASATLSRELDVNGTDVEVSGTLALDNNNRDGFNYYVGAGLSVNINRGSEQSAMDRAMGSGLSRQMAPMTAVETGETQTLDGTVTLYGQDLTGLTEISAVDDVQASLDAANSNQLVLLSGKDGAIDITTGINLNENQVVIGNGIPLVVKGPNGEQAVLILPESQATLTNGQITLGSGSALAYTNIEDSSIVANGGDSVVLDNNTMTNMSDISINDVQAVTVSNNTITGLDNFDIRFNYAEVEYEYPWGETYTELEEVNEDHVYTNTIDILNNTVTDVLGTDIHGADTLNFNNNTFHTAEVDLENYNGPGPGPGPGPGIDGSDIDMTNVTSITALENDVIMYGEFDIDDAHTVLIDGGTYASYTDDAIMVSGNDFDAEEGEADNRLGSSAVINNVTVTEAGFEGIDVDDFENITVTNNTILDVTFDEEDENAYRNNSDNGIEVDNYANAVITGNTVVGYENAALDIDQDYEGDDAGFNSPTTVISDNTFTNVDEGIDMENSGTVTVTNNTISATGEGIMIIGDNDERRFSEVIVTGNTVTTVEEEALHIQHADNVTVTGNTLNGTTDAIGVYLNDVKTATISSNTLKYFNKDVKLNNVDNVLFELNNFYKENAGWVFMEILGENGVIEFLNNERISDIQGATEFKLDATMTDVSGSIQRWEVTATSGTSVGMSFYCEVDNASDADFARVNCIHHPM